MAVIPAPVIICDTESELPMGGDWELAICLDTGKLFRWNGASWAANPLNVFSATEKGLVPASGGGTTNFARADGTWAAPPGGGSVNSVSGSDPIASTGGANPVISLNNGGVTLAKMADLAANSMIGNNTGAPAVPLALTVAQTLSMLGTFSSVILRQFTTPGANTYTPTAGMKFCLAISTGGGGGGGGADTSNGSGDVGVGGGGGAGGTCIEVFSAATIGVSQTVTIGAAGTAGSGTNGTSGGAGGNTTFGALHTANGGAFGTGSGVSAVDAQASAGGVGGVPTGGLANITGGAGDYGFGGSADGTIDLTFGHGGKGGGSMWGGGGQAGAVAGNVLTTDLSIAGGAGLAYGAGGAGGVALNTNTGVAGGAGMSGFCLVIEFI